MGDTQRQLPEWGNDASSGDVDTSNEFFLNLLDHTIGLRGDALDEPLDHKGYVFMEDLALIADPEYNAFMQVFVENEEVFEHVFAKDWTKLWMQIGMIALIPMYAANIMKSTEWLVDGRRLDSFLVVKAWKPKRSK